MYRAVALAAVERKLDWDDPEALAKLAGELSIEVYEEQVLLDGRDVTEQIRTFEITLVTHYAADNPGVREVLVELQRRAAAGLDVVTEGRDQGTVVFPRAECKVFLTASAERRAKRRFKDLVARGETVSFEEVLAKQQCRDTRDRSRDVGPLVQAVDATEVNTDGLSPEEVVDALEVLAQSKL